MTSYSVAPPGFRLPDETRLGRVLLQVANLDRSIEYYRRVIGLEVGLRDGDRATLQAAGGSEPLVELRELPGAVPVPRRGRLGLFHFALLLPSRGDLGRFLAHLATTGERAGSADHLVSEALYLTDPDGLGIEVYADRPRAAWRVEGGNLAMSTDPLDVGDLIAGAGSERWNGAPRGTVMGHVHLHVGDLAEGARFYHEGLGFDRIVLSFPGALFMSAGGYHHHLGINVWARGAPLAGERDARLLEWLVLVPGPDALAAAAQSIRDAGYPVSEGPDAVTAADPWGTTVRIAVAPSDGATASPSKA